MRKSRGEHIDVVWAAYCVKIGDRYDPYCPLFTYEFESFGRLKYWVKFEKPKDMILSRIVKEFWDKSQMTNNLIGELIETIVIRDYETVRGINDWR